MANWCEVCKTGTSSHTHTLRCLRGTDSVRSMRARLKRAEEAIAVLQEAVAKLASHASGARR